MTRIEKAIKFVSEKYGSKLDRYGKLEMLHPFRVGMRGATTEEKIVGLFHDLIEDGFATFEEIEKLFGREIAVAVELVSRDPEKITYRDFIKRIAESGDKTAIYVKLHDLADNLSRIHELPVEKRGVEGRYISAVRVLEKVVHK